MRSGGSRQSLDSYKANKKLNNPVFGGHLAKMLALFCCLFVGVAVLAKTSVFKENFITLKNITPKMVSLLKGQPTGFAAIERQVVPSGDTVDLIEGEFSGHNDSNLIGQFINNAGTINQIIATVTGNKLNLASGSSGLIYNDSTGVIGSLTGTFTNNSFTASGANTVYGAAIYNNGGVITVNAVDNNVLFSNNSTVNGSDVTYSDVYNVNTTSDPAKGTINLNAKAGQKITFNGSIDGDGTGTLVLNNDAENKGGEYVFNNGINNQILEMHNGAIIRLGKVVQEDGTTTYGKLNLAGFRPITDSGLSPQAATVILDLRNDYIDVHQFGHVIQGASVNHMLDVDLVAGTADRFDALSTTAVTGDILVGGLNLMSGSGDGQMIVNLSRNSFRFAFSLTRDILDNITMAEGVTYNVRTLDYDYFSGNLIFNAEEFNPNGGTLDKVYKNSRDYLNLGIGQHATYSSSDLVDYEHRGDDHPYIVIINGNVYYFASKESTDELSNAIIDLAATGSTAIKEVTSEDNYIFEKGGRYYTYTTIFLPKSVWYNELIDDPSDGYNYYQTDGTTNKYYNVVLRTDLMRAIDTTVWTKSDSTTAGTYTWDPDTYIPHASEIKPVMNGNNLISASGMVRFNLPYNGTTTETRYYKYDYTTPADYTRQTSRITMSDNYITNLYFYKMSNGSKGSSVYNNTTANYNINADFIGNTTSNDGGAIYNDSSGKLGFISGTFIKNTGSQGGVMLNNTGGTVKALIGDFIGNYAVKSGGVIRNVSGTVGLIQGKFIGNRAGTDGGDGWGGVISNKNSDSRMEIVLGDFIGNRASKGGGAIDMNGRLGTVIGDFIGNFAYGGDGGGAVRVDGGFIGSVTGDFIGNWAQKGGAIYTQNSGSEIGTVYSDFIGNQATSGNGGAVAVDHNTSVISGIYGNFINNSATGNGAAVYTKGKINRISANFTDNVAGGKGGAIYLDSGSAVIALYADTFGDILFTDNKAGSAYNDVYNNGGTLKLNAQSYTEESVTKQHTITFDGSIEGDGTGKIEINNDSTVKGGKYIFNNTVSGNKVYLYNNADVKLGSVSQSDNSNNVGRFNINTLQNDTNHGSIDLQNGYIEPEVQSFGTVTLKSDLYLKIDVDLVNKLADKFSATSFTSGTYKFIINSINVLADSPDDSAVEVNVAEGDLKSHFGLADSAISVEGLTKSYLVTYSAATGNLKFAGENLYYAVHSEASERNYNMLAEEILWCDLGTMAGSGSTLTINGGGFDINGYDGVSHYSGIIVKSGQTLNVNNVGAWKNMSGGDGSVLNNSGTLNITNSNFADNVSTSNGLIYNTGGSANVTITNSSFTDNTGRAVYNTANISSMSGVTITGGGFSTASESGGAIYNSGTITTMENVVIRETTSKVGSAIFNTGHIGTIRNMTISGSVSADNIFGNESNATIDLIDNMTIENSLGAGLSFFGASATTIRNSTFTGTYGNLSKTIFGIQFSNNGGTASSAQLIENVIVSSNQHGGIRIDDKGNNNKSYIGLIKNSQILDNGVTDKAVAGGIWAKTNTLTISADGEGKKTVFRGNKRQNVSTGIWMENKNSTLNLQQLNNGEMYMYDRVRGTSDKYYVNISGDNTGTLYLYDDIENGIVDIQDTKINTTDGVIHSYTFSSLQSDADTKYFLDINFRTDNLPASTIDNFTISSSSGTSGLITLKALNFINDVQAMTAGMEATVQILHSPTGNLQLAKGFDKEGDFDVLYVLQDDTRQEIEEIAPVTNWHEDIAIYAVRTKILGQADLQTTTTTNDTLHILIHSALQDKVQIGSMDTLAAVNQVNLYTRSFVTTTENDVFNVSTDLGVTEGGYFTVQGADPVNHSIIDFNETEHYKGFELDRPTVLTLKNVEIKNSSQLVSGTSTNATIRVYDSYLHDNGEGIYTAGNMNVEGTTRIDDDVHLMGDSSTLSITGAISAEPVDANVTFNGEIKGTETSTVTFGAGTVNLGNQASVSDTKLTLSNTTLNVGANDAFSHVNLTSGNSTMDLKNGSVGVQSFDALTLSADMNIGIDVDLAHLSTDKIVVPTAGAEAVTTNGNNIIINSIYIMTDAASTTANVILTEDSRFSGVYKLSDDIVAHVTRAGSVTGSYTINYADFDPLVDADKGILIFTLDNTATLASTIVKDEGPTAVKGYFLPVGGETVEANLGTLIGAKLVINGNNQEDTNFIHGGNNHTGVVLGDGQEQTLEVRDVDEWSGFTDSAIKNKSDGTVIIENTNFSGNTTSDIDNSGVLEFSGTNTLQKVNDSATTANGTIEIKDGTTTIANVQQKSVTVTDGKLIVSNNLTTTSGVINNIDNGLEITGGTINSSVSGEDGSVKINSAGTVSLTDEKTISQQINLTAGTFNTSASGIAGGLHMTGGTIELTGGILTSAISGTAGSINIKDNVTANANISGSHVNLKSGTLILNNGTFVNIAGLTADGGHLSTQNGTTSATNLSSATLNSDMNWSLDMSLTGLGSADILTVTNITTNSNDININNINWLGSNTALYGKKIALTGTNPILANAITTSVTSYVVDNKTYNLSIEVGEDNKAYLEFALGDLYTAVHDTAATREYSIPTGGENVNRDLGAMEGENATLTIEGETKAINGDNHAGITVANGQTLNVNNVSSYNGFTTALTNAGTLNINGVVFEDNTTADINNTGSVVLTGTNEFNGKITGTTGTIAVNGGSTEFKGTVTQATLSIVSGSVTANASNLTANIVNADSLTFTGGANANTITGVGKTIISGATSNTGSITQGTLQTDAVLTNTGSVTVNTTLTNTAGISNKGTLTVKGTNNLGSITDASTPTGILNAEGTLTANDNITQNTVKVNSGKLTVTEGKDITASTIAITAAEATLEGNASNLKGDISNAGNLNLTGGTTQGNITGVGYTNVSGNLIVDNYAISDNTMVLKSGEVSVTNDGSLALGGLTAQGGTLNTQNGVIDNPIALGVVDLATSGVGMKINMDLSGTGSVDYFTGTTTYTGENKLSINNIVILNDPTQDVKNLSIRITDGGAGKIAGLFDFTNAGTVNGADNKVYKLVYTSSGENAGLITFDYGNLYTAVKSSGADRTYTMTTEEKVLLNLGAMETDNATLTINGGNNKITGRLGDAEGAKAEGITVANGQTLNVNNVSSFNTFTTALTNNGTINLTNVVFEGNTRDIVNNATLNLYGTDSIKTISGSTGVINIGDATDTTKTGTVTFQENGVITQSAINILNADSSLTNLTGSTITATIDNAGTLTNSGTITGDVTNSGTLTSSVNDLQGAISNTGTFNATGELAKTISGEGTTLVNSTLTLNNNGNISGTLNANGGTITLSTNSITSHNIGTLTGNGNLVIDINTGAGTVDNISYTTGGTGTLKITSLNDIGTKPTEEGTYTYTVLTGSGITLALDNTIATSSDWYQEETTTHGPKTPDAIQVTTKWTDKYYERWIDTTTGKSLDVSGNNLVFNVVNHQTEQKSVLGDTLSLVNQAELATRNFTTNDATKTYTLTAELGETKSGNFTISGEVSGTDISTIDLDNNTGFNLTNATNLTLTDVKLTGASGSAVTLNNANAQLNVSENSVVDGNVTNTNGAVDNDGTITGTVTNAGTFTNDGTVTGNVTNSGTLTSSVNDLQGAISNTGTFNATGELAKTISGEGTTLVNSTLTLNNNGNISGTLNANGGTITLSTNSITSHNIGTLTGNGNLVIDINTGAGTVDNISYTTGGTGTLKITSLNDIGTKPTEEGTYTYTVLTGSGITLALDNTIATSSDWYQEETITPGTKTPDAIQANTAWNHKYYERWENTHTAKSLTVSGNDLVFTVMNHQTDEKESLGDTLKLVNQDTTNAEKNFTADADGAEYVVSENLGATKGTVNISGVSGGSAETINLNGKTGFELGTDATALNFSNVTVGGNTTIATVTNADAVVNVNNSVINGAITGAVAYALNTSGTTTLSNVTAGTLTNTGALTLAGDTTATTITNSGTIQNNGLLTGAITNNGGASLTSLANKIAGNISNAGNLYLTGGANTNAITGEGTTTFSNESSNSASIENDVDNTGTLTNTGSITGNLANSNSIINSGSITTSSLTNNGSIENNSAMTVSGTNSLGTISGAGTINTSGAITIDKAITQSDINVQSGTLTVNANVTSDITNAGDITNSATITGGLINSGSFENTGNGSISGAIVNAGDATITSNANNLSGTIYNAGALVLTGGETQNTISGTGHTDIKGNVTISKAITGNNVHLENDGVATLTDSGSLGSGITANGGALSLQGLSTSIITNLGNVILNSDMNLSIDADLANQSANKISAGTVISNNNSKIIISAINILSDAAMTPLTINVADDITKAYVNLSDDVAITTSRGTAKGSYLVTYADGDLTFKSAGLKYAIISEAEEKVYKMTENETIDETLTLGGKSMTINGNGTAEIKGSGVGEISIANQEQTLSFVNAIVDGFDTAIDNSAGGDINITDTTFSNNTTDLINDGNINFYGTDSVKNITDNSGQGTAGVINIGNDTTAGSVTFQEGGSIIQKEINVAANSSLDNNATINTDTVSNKGDITNNNSITANVVKNEGNITNDKDITAKVTNSEGATIANKEGATLTLKDGSSNAGDITGAGKTTVEGNTTNSGNITQGVIDATTGTLTNTGSVVADTLNVESTGAVTNNNSLSIKNGTNEGTISGTGTTTISGGASDNFANSGTLSQNNLNVQSGTLTNTGVTSVADTLNNAGTIANNGNGSTSGVLNIKDGTNSGTIEGTGVVNISGSVTNNGTIEQAKATVKDGGSLTNLADNLKSETEVESGAVLNINGGKTQKDIANNGTVNVKGTTEINNKITGIPDGNVNIDAGDGKVNINNVIAGTNLTLTSGTMALEPYGSISGASNFYANGGTISAINNHIEQIDLGNVVITGTPNLAIDFHLNSAKSDSFIGDFSGTGKFDVSTINVIGTDLKNSIAIKISTLTGIPDEYVTADDQKLKSVTTSIKKYNGYIKDGILYYGPAKGTNPDDYNPGVLAAPIAAQLGGYLTQLNTYDEAFKNLDMKMLMTKKEREAYKFANKSACLEGGLKYTLSHPVEQEPALWFRGYATFEKVNLSNGPRVSNILYGSFGGGESKMYDIGHGFMVQYAGYLGYTGSHQAYAGNDIYQNGGALGVSAMLYKGNFFAGVTANIGATVADVSTNLGSEDFPMLMGGGALKTGYNWELADGKFVIQPSYLMSYTFVNAFDYTNAKGVKIKDSPLHAINIAPGLKFIGNLANGWQPYMSIQMVWNILDKTNFTAADIQLPYMSIRPYIQYGIGIQKHYGDRFTGYVQAMLRNGGRNGVALSLGLRYALGSKHSTINSDRTVIKEAPVQKNNVIKKVMSKTGIKRSVTIKDSKDLISVVSTPKLEKHPKIKARKQPKAKAKKQPKVEN